MNSISVVMPCYKGENYIEQALQRTCKTLAQITKDYEIILVVDGNLDKTFEKAVNFSKKNGKVKPFTYEKNKGKGFAIKHGCHFVSKELTVFIDSDLDLPPEQLKIFLEFFTQLDADIVIGSKRHPLSKIKYPATRRFLSKCYSLFIRALFGLNISDTQVGFKLMKTTVARRAMPKIVVKRYAFDLEFLVVAKTLGYKIVEAPVIILFKNIGTMVNPKQIWRIFVDTIAIFYRLHFLHYYD